MSITQYFSEFTSQFHFLRPWWLVAILPMALLIAFSWRKERVTSDWQTLIAPEFLSYLLDRKIKIAQSTSLWLVSILWLLATIALAGPSWHKHPTAIEKNQNALVILLDLSPSMLSQDLRPTRLARAKLKIADLLRERSDGLSALAVYAGEAHLVTPLSDDQNTLLNLLPSLDPQIMPTQGSNTEDAISLAIKLLNNAGATNGNILLITDGVVPDAFSRIESDLQVSNYSLDILGIGTQNATPIAASNGGFLRDSQGAIITTQLNSEILRSLALKVRGNYYEITTDNADILAIASELNHPALADKNNSIKHSMQRDFDQWNDEGIWILFCILPLLLYCFRRGFLSIVLIGNLFLLTFSSLSAPNADAVTLEDWFKTKNQQAQEAFDQGKHDAAAQEFENPEWRATAKYKAGHFEEAANDYATLNTPQADYNRGNALAKAGKLEDAIKAYTKALEKKPDLADAKKNRDLVQSMLDKQKQDQQKNQQNQKDQNDQKDQKDQKEKGDSQKDEQSKDSSKQDQKNGDESAQQKEQDAKNGKQNSSQQSAGGKESSSASDSNSQKASNQGQSSSAMSNGAQTDTQAQASSSKAPQPTDQNLTAENNSKENNSKKDAVEKAKTVDPYEAKMTPEERAAMQQWLRQVPDDPGGLLREKFKWQAIHNRENGSDGEEQKSNNQPRW